MDKFKWKSFAVRNQRFRMVGKDQLYDMEKDPSQTTNVISEHPQVAARMTAAYEEFWDQAVPLMVNEKVPMSKTRPFHEDYRKQEQQGGIPMWEPEPAR